MAASINTGIFIQYFATFSAAATLITSGANYVWTSPYLPQLLQKNSSIPTTEEEAAWCTILPLFTEAAGGIIAACLVDRLGRKYSILAAIPFQIGAFLAIAFAKTIWVLIIARSVVGGLDGYMFTVVPTYIAEICQPERRGFLSATVGLSGVLGMLLINTIGPYTSIFVSSMILMGISVVQLILFFSMPESPYFYIKKNRNEEAMASLVRLRNKSDNIQDEFDDLCTAVRRQEKGYSGKMSELFTIPSNRRACLIFVILCLGNKLTGRAPIIFYTNTIFIESGSVLGGNLSSIVYCLVEVTTYFLTICIVDRFGRKILITTSAVGCIMSLLTLGLHFNFKDYASYPSSLDWVPLAALISYSVVFNSGLAFGQVSVLGELFPTSVKGYALCLAQIFSSAAAATSSKFFQEIRMASDGMAVPFFCFAVFTAVSLFFIIRYVPETKGKTLEEIQLYLISKSEKLTDNMEMTSQEFKPGSIN